MVRAHRAAIYLFVFLIVYLLACFAVLPIPLVEPHIPARMLPVIPWWLLVSFGAYSIASLGWGLFTSQDWPDAYHELLRESSDFGPGMVNSFHVTPGRKSTPPKLI